MGTPWNKWYADWVCRRIPIECMLDALKPLYMLWGEPGEFEAVVRTALAESDKEWEKKWGTPVPTAGNQVLVPTFVCTRSGEAI